MKIEKHHRPEFTNNFCKTITGTGDQISLFPIKKLRSPSHKILEKGKSMLLSNDNKIIATSKLFLLGPGSVCDAAKITINENTNAIRYDLIR